MNVNHPESGWDTDFNQMNAVITGGGGALCSEMALALAKLGTSIAVLDLDEHAAQEVVKRITQEGGRGIAVGCNVVEPDSLVDAAKEVTKSLGGIDILINGAGGNHPGATTSQEISFFELNPNSVRKVFDLNFLGTFLASQVFGEVMAHQEAGNIINIASMNSLRPLTKIPAYSAAKAAVANFTQWLAVHMAMGYSPSIRVNAIAPGFFITAQNRYLLINEEDGKFTERGTRILDHIPAGRFGSPQDLISTLMWLLSPASSYVTGILVPVDGGFSAYSGV